MNANPETLKKTLNEKGYEFETIRQEVSALEEEINQVSARVDSFQAAKTALDAYKNAKPGQELIIPVGEGVFVKAAVSKSDKAMFSVGSNVVVTKNISESLTYVDERIDEADKLIETLSGNITYFTQKMQQLEHDIQGIMSMLKSEEAKQQAKK